MTGICTECGGVIVFDTPLEPTKDIESVNGICLVCEKEYVSDDFIGA